jgi:hypothetical protein
MCEPPKRRKTEMLRNATEQRKQITSFQPNTGFAYNSVKALVSIHAAKERQKPRWC